jgi:hypothetical protein
MSSPCSPLRSVPPPVSSGEHATVPNARAGVGLRWTERVRPVHGDVDPVHGFIRWKLIHYSDISEILQRGPWTFGKSTRSLDFADFALRPLGFSKINPQSTNFSRSARNPKIITKRSLASEKSTKIAPKLQKFIYFHPQLQIQ